MASGSEKRQKAISLSARFDGREAALVRDNADRAGVSVASLIRMALLDEPRARATRIAPVNVALLGRLIFELGPVADSLRRIAQRPEFEAADPTLTEALEQLADISFLCLQAMGRTRPQQLASKPRRQNGDASLSLSWQNATDQPDPPDEAEAENAPRSRPRLPFDPGGPA